MYPRATFLSLILQAERRMPEWITKTRSLLDKVGIQDDIIMRMTGCPNGCARPYMAELSLVGDGPDSYQVLTILHVHILSFSI